MRNVYGPYSRTEAQTCRPAHIRRQNSQRSFVPGGSKNEQTPNGQMLIDPTLPEPQGISRPLTPRASWSLELGQLAPYTCVRSLDGKSLAICRTPIACQSLKFGCKLLLACSVVLENTMLHYCVSTSCGSADLDLILSLLPGLQFMHDQVCLITSPRRS